MKATITFSKTEMKHVEEFCRRTKRNYHMLVRGLRKRTFTINLDNPCVFWIPQQDGMTGVNMRELGKFIVWRKNEAYRHIRTRI